MKKNNNIIKAHNGPQSEMIRNGKYSNKDYNLDKEIAKLEKWFLLQDYNSSKVNDIKKLINKIVNYYETFCPEHLIDSSLNAMNSIFFNLLSLVLSDEEKSLIDFNFDGRIVEKNEKYDIEMIINPDESITINKMDLFLKKKDKIKKLDITDDFKNLNIHQVRDLLQEYNIYPFTYLFSNKCNEFLYKKNTIAKIYEYVIYTLINRSKVNGSKRALIFCRDIKADNKLLEIPMLYGMTYDPKESFDMVNVYSGLGGRMNALVIPDYDSLESYKLTKNLIPLHVFVEKKKYYLNQNKGKRRVI